MNANDLLAKRAGLIAEARAILDSAEKRGELTLSAEDEERFEKLHSEARALKAQADRLIALEADEASLREVGEPRAAKREQPATADTEERIDPLAAKEYRKAFERYIRFGEVSPVLRIGKDDGKDDRKEDRALGTANTAGGYTIPTDLYRNVIDVALRNVNVMRQVATVQTFDNATNVATVSAHGAAAWTTQASSYNESDETFGQVTFSAYKATRIIRINEELLEDTIFDIESYLAQEFAKSFGELEEAAFVNGSGSGQPTGVVGGSTAGTTAAGSTAVTTDELLGLYHAVPRYYRSNAVWMFADATALKLRKLKGGDGQYLWQPGLTAGQPDTLLGKPVYISDNVPAMTTGNKAVLFGDMSQYWIVDRRGIVFKRLNELYAATGQVGFAASIRTDGKLTVATAVYHIPMA